MALRFFSLSYAKEQQYKAPDNAEAAAARVLIAQLRLLFVAVIDLFPAVCEWLPYLMTTRKRFEEKRLHRVAFRQHVGGRLLLSEI
mmetsp:Transcript_25159/g.37180  ORF Transcript_25159/g.37180 Transcript_25159/m.37180 type:complete len:86 (+) Transcript_25159:1282-1539(+)